ncbi:MULTISPECIES: beta-ketoacyl synthase chain length factor [Dyella]|uniref:Beta-ketoacyl synthase-like N-terminal domain-containing protein n=2 Tax=Dyella TaxID=231454 RepID=A0A4R0YLN1_9GAMM|nr:MULTISPECIES: beta-ketoacyl synthase chain length factor [Dyella]TBR36550.1 hypothetical protein EYV96_11490 [Dyella terrae]TCI08358.1 hypothetical protein EZM97_27380 [Dyella soli]
MSVLEIFIDGAGLWSPYAARFDAFRHWLESGMIDAPETARPPAERLPANERRRAPEHVLLAIEAAGQAIGMSGYDAAELACVFTSAHGDQAITDYMCATLADDPTALSPTRFHNSVHNAPAGYWTIATGCRAPSAAVCGHRASVGAGLLEAAMLTLADERPVLLVCSDIAGSGPIAEMTGSTQSFGCAFVLSPRPGPHTLARLVLHPTHGGERAPAGASVLPPDWSRANSTAADALPLLMLVAGHGRQHHLPAAAHMGLEIRREVLA